MELNYRNSNKKPLFLFAMEKKKKMPLFAMERSSICCSLDCNGEEEEASVSIYVYREREEVVFKRGREREEYVG